MSFERLIKTWTHQLLRSPMRGRRILCLLMAGVLFCLLLPALSPHPSPAETLRPLRRIHQEEDYTGPKTQPPGPQDPKARPSEVGSEKPVVSAVVTTHSAVSSSQSVSAPRTQLDPVLEVNRDIKKVYPKTRMAQDRIYLTSLRDRKQVVPRPGGGEQIMSYANRTVRFPVLLKKVATSNWPKQYGLYLNLTHHLWVRTRGCRNYSTTFAPPHSLSPRALASFPSSGNTWIRYLIEGATGLFTGSMYDDTSLTMKGLYGEALLYDSGMTVLQKSHGYTTGDAMMMDDRQQRARHSHIKELGYSGVVVMRNPFKALISHRHLDVGGHTGYAPKAHFLGQGWAEFVRLKVNLWQDFYVDWITLTSPSNIHVTHYENLRQNPVLEMRGILDYLGIRQDPSRLKCLSENLDGLFKRRVRMNSLLGFDPFTKELRRVIYGAIYSVDLALKSKGFGGLPISKYEVYDAKEAEVLRLL